MKIKKYDPKLYNFCKEVEKYFNIQAGKLDEIHNIRKDLIPFENLNFNNETKTKFHEIFYSNLNSRNGKEIQSIYEQFIEDIVAPLFSDNFLYQKFPSFRIHLPDRKAIHKWHYDSDPDHKHPLWEINFQIALTKAYDTNAMWLESVPGLKDYKPVELDVGQIAIFNGNTCSHGNKHNVTNKTRVSMDFRVLPYQRYKQQEEQALESVTAKLKFKPSGYYNLYDKDKNVRRD